MTKFLRRVLFVLAVVLMALPVAENFVSLDCRDPRRSPTRFLSFEIVFL